MKLIQHLICVQKAASAASSRIKKLGSIASQGAEQLASSSVQPRDTSLLYGTGEEDFYIPNTQPRDTSLLLGDGTGQKKFTNDTKAKAKAKAKATAKAKAKAKAKASKTTDEEYEDLMKDVGKNTKKQTPQKMTADEQRLFEEMTKKAQ